MSASSGLVQAVLFTTILFNTFISQTNTADNPVDIEFQEFLANIVINSNFGESFIPELIASKYIIKDGRKFFLENLPIFLKRYVFENMHKNDKST